MMNTKIWTLKLPFKYASISDLFWQEYFLEMCYHNQRILFNNKTEKNIPKTWNMKKHQICTTLMLCTCKSHMITTIHILRFSQEYKCHCHKVMLSVNSYKIIQLWLSALVSAWKQLSKIFYLLVLVWSQYCLVIIVTHHADCSRDSDTAHDEAVHLQELNTLQQDNHWQSSIIICTLW